MALDDWLLLPQERGNPATDIDSRHPEGVAWTTGNDVTVLVHGAPYFADLAHRVQQMRAGDYLLFTDWRGDPDERVGPDGLDIATMFAKAAERGVVVKGLVWRSHLDRFTFSEEENRHLGEDIEAAGGECLRDMRVRPGGSHHQKFVVLRHPGRPDRDVAYVGGIDLCHSRRDDESHEGDPQRQPMPDIYGPRPPWHDIQLRVSGPAVGDVERVFRERWEDKAALSRNPINRFMDLVRREDDDPDPLPEPAPPPGPHGRHTVQLLRTYPYRLLGYPFAPQGERSVARGYLKALSRAQALIYVEDQYFWSAEVAESFADALRNSPQLRLIVVVPHYSDQTGRLSSDAALVGRQEAMDAVQAAGGDRVAVYGLENHSNVPVYVHAKACVVDDVWASVGSDNVNRRSWTHDSELACVVLDEELDQRTPDRLGDQPEPARRFARDLRLQLSREHLDRHHGDDDDLLDPIAAFSAYADSAARLQAWHDGGRRGQRPPGRLRRYRQPRIEGRRKLVASAFYRTVSDPDGRPPRLRRSGEF